MNRIEKILSLIPSKTLLGLAIGPSYNPITPKRDVEIVDHANTEELKKKYNAWNVQGTELIEEVNHVVGTNGIYATINRNNHYDFIIASHVIEHTPDFIQFLIDCQRLLKVGGILSLVIPDKRCCFDVLKPLTKTGQVIQDQRKKHSPGTIFDAHALHATKNGGITWPADSPTEEITFVHTIQEAKSIMDDYIATDNYLDVHVWQFTYESFRKIICDLQALQYTTLTIADEYPTDGIEFYFSLRKQ